MLTIYVTLVALSCFALLSEAASPSTTIDQGNIRGSWMRSRQGRQIAAFRGIPYAAPPVGNLRFKSPQPVKPWSGRKLVREDGNKCVQYNLFLGIHGEEDCLYLNVYTPKVGEDNLLPVLFFIHGGAFKTGSGGSFLYGPDILLDEDMVLVTVNYRLGVFGFLSFEDSVLPGNLGLKDQRMALRWVRDNIHHFGGDPDKVTMFGESAGAMSAHYHMLFNSEEGLFRAAILHSGTAFNPGAFQRPGEQKALISHILTESNCEEGNSSLALHCLQKVRPYRLTRIVNSFFPSFDSLMRKVELSPVIEPDCVDDAIITENPWNRKTSLPIIIGTNKYEALFTFADVIRDDSERSFEEFNRNYKKILPYNLVFEESSENSSSVVDQLKRFYFQDKNITRQNLIQLANLLSDGLFNIGTTETVERNMNDTYLFSLNHLGSKSFLNLLGLDNIYGPTHVDDLFYFFPFPLLQTHRPLNYAKAAEQDRVLSQKLVKTYFNFITDLEPRGIEGVDWEPVSGEALGYLSIDGPDNLTMASHFYSERMDFWQNLPFRNKPFPDSLQCSSP